MAAPMGNKHAIGNRGGRRKGYEFESKQLKKMYSLLDKDLVLLEKLYAGKIAKEDLEKLQVAQSRMMKILDKLHATKTTTDVSIKELPKPILDVSENYSNQKNNNSG